MATHALLMQKKAGFMEARLLGLFDVSNAYKR
jgi:hypothetical protein